MQIDMDWHIHSRHSPCGNPEATLARILCEARAAGITCLGVTDHLNGPPTEAAVRAARAEYDALPEKDGFLFGIEATCLRRYDVEEARRLGAAAGIWGQQKGGPAGGELTVYLPEALLAEVRPAYVIGGAHWTLGVPLDRESVIREYHRQSVHLARHPEVDIVAHPWWWQGAWRDADGMYRTLPWFDDFSVIPPSMHEELAAAARENGTAIEINAGAIFTNPAYPERFKEQYLEYLACMKELGVTFSLASDSHHPGYDDRLHRIAAELDRLDLTEAHFWRPSE
ncbi:MAG: hypothetical protein GXY85_08125 [Candidatus Brocadiaceae bacterium]|nr:hypothetical protein [Candidatus Brocadiaceae bacterium]